MRFSTVLCSALAAFTSLAAAAPMSYNVTGDLTQPEPMPFTPAGGIQTNATEAMYPYYHPLSDFDYESLSLALNQEWIELDLFHHGLAMFSHQDFADAGLTAEDRFLIEFMADQEVGHARLLTNIIGAEHAPKRCTYKYPFKTVKEFIDFCQKLTRWGESGVYGFLEHLDSRAAAQLLLQSISTEARQQMTFRQFEGLPAQTTWFIPGITQSMAWTLLAPYIESCPADQPRLAWQNFPALNVTNNPDVITGDNWLGPAITHNRTALSYPGKMVHLSWENPGMTVGWNNSYMTNTTAGTPVYAAWISQLNVTYTPLTNISGNTAWAEQPEGVVFSDDNVVNGTSFVLVSDSNPYLTPFNISMLNPHVVAGPAVYQSG